MPGMVVLSQLRERQHGDAGFGKHEPKCRHSGLAEYTLKA